MENLDLTKQIPLNKTCLIEASAGTGKTYSITNIFLHAVLAGIPVEEILVVTFTEAATKELRSRIREKVTESIDCLKNSDSSDETLKAIIFELFDKVDRATKQTLLDTALLNIDQASIFTIHSFCQRMLTENAFESKIAYGAELLTDESEIIEELTENFWRQNLLNVSAEDRELYSGIKFDDLLKLAKELVKYHNIEVVNDKLEVPPAIETLEIEYRQLLAEAQVWVAKFELPKLEDQMTRFFSAMENSCMAAYKGEKLAKKLTKALKSIQTLRDDRPLKHFTYDALAKAFKKGVTVPRHDFFELCTRLIPVIEVQKSIEQVTDENRKYLKLDIYNSLNYYIKTQFKAIKEERNILTFNDLLVRLYEALNSEKTAKNRPLTRLIRAKFRLALVDEFQDTDDIQYEIFNMLFGSDDGKHGFFMIGDPKQSIYKFRGADIFSYLTAKKSADQAFTLATNYRSEEGMVDAVNELFGLKGRTATFAFPPKGAKPGITYENVQAGSKKAKLLIEGSDSQPLQFWLVDGFNDSFAERNIAINMAAEIVRLIDDCQTRFDDGRLLTPGDFAILVNTHKQAAMVKSILTKSKIAAVIQNSVKIFDTWEARELQLWIKAVINPIERHIRPLLVTNLLSHSLAQIDDLQDREMLELTEELTLLNKLWQKNGFFAIFLRFISKYEVREKVLTTLNGERVITNYIHLAELLHKHELKNGRSVEKALTYLEQQIADGEADDEYTQRLESDSKAVKIMTIHKAKGLEFPVVFCPFIWSNAIDKGERSQTVFLFNQEEHDRYIQKLDFGADKTQRADNRLRARHETIAEQIRLMYVAVTRAANRCYLPVGNMAKVGKSIFGYLFTDESLEDDESRSLLSKIFGPGSKHMVKAIQESSLAGIKQLVADSAHIGLVEKSEIKVVPLLSKTAISAGIDLQARSFSRAHLYKWGVGSFSSLIKNQPYKGDQTALGSGVFSLPKGKNFGLAVHTIFQNYFTFGKAEFYADLGKYLETPLKVEDYFRLSDRAKQAERFGIAQQMIANVLEQPITVGGDSLRLADITPDNAKAELDFFYQVNKISPPLLKEIFATHGVDEIQEFQATLDKLKFSLRRGYMNGEIDLLFRHNGKYYILDWKTNHLGPQAINYSSSALRENMAEHFYLLQYHIYTLAAHLFLKQQLQGYDYNKDFGGVLYIYTRGFDGNGNGIFFDKPPQILIETLEKELVK